MVVVSVEIRSGEEDEAAKELSMAKGTRSDGGASDKVDGDEDNDLMMPQRRRCRGRLCSGDDLRRGWNDEILRYGVFWC